MFERIKKWFKDVRTPGLLMRVVLCLLFGPVCLLVRLGEMVFEFIATNSIYRVFTLIFRPLIKFSQSGNLRMVKLLLKLGFNPNKIGYVRAEEHIHGKENWEDRTFRTVYPITPLISVIISDIPIDKKKSIIKLLLENGANIDEEVNYIYYCFEKESLNPLKAACNRKDLEMVKFLVEQGVNVNYTYSYGSVSILAELARRYDAGTEIMEYLIKKGADVNYTGDGRSSALMLACRSNNFEGVKVLINNGANINYVDKWGGNSLKMASVRYSYPCARYLICKGATFEYDDIPKLFGEMTDLEPKILCAIYNKSVSELCNLLKSYNKEINTNSHTIDIQMDACNFSNILKKHILPEVCSMKSNLHREMLNLDGSDEYRMNEDRLNTMRMSLEDLDIIEKQIKDFTAIVTTKLNEDIISLSNVGIERVGENTIEKGI